MKQEGVLSELVRARLTSAEYDGLTKETVEKFYIEEYGQLPPPFEIIHSDKLQIGEESGFNGTAIHFFDDKQAINEVYVINRGTEGDLSKFAELGEKWFKTLKNYKQNPENLKEIVFSGNEDIYTDAYEVLLGDDQSQIEDNQDFKDKVIQKVNEKNLLTKPVFFLDAHSLGGNQGQTLMVTSGDLFTDVNVYNDAPMNIYTIVRMHDKIRKIIEDKYGILADEHDIYKIKPSELYSILDKELGSYASKITYYRNEEDLLTNLTLPYAYRLTNKMNVVTFDSDSKVGRPVDLAAKYPDLTGMIVSILDRANQVKGLSYPEIAFFAKSGFVAAALPSLFHNDFERRIGHLIDDFEGIDLTGHAMDVVIAQIAKQSQQKIVNNELMIKVADIDGGEIEINLDAAYRFYSEGYSLLFGKEETIPAMERVFQTYIVESYQRHVTYTTQQMAEIEENPEAFLSSSDRYTVDVQYHVKYSNFRFLDRPRPQLAPNITMLFDEVIAGIRLETNRQKEFLEKYKDGIKKLAETDERIALLFDTHLERRQSW
ncbi:hypothetical protein H1Z61_11480 [Bacillus aquiflavi]|uniref:DUF6792 domain-containing protein n=1 Tax=Bacillus aquiflavi TaxID=2672567 RepID=A0A6B3VVE2_9BACI|nr:DUF6792 domain-containing protein [Bacillus aquiflavi]MBA4537732.1 hypothetical protein [Bacillus aquiflavi]NEY81989.1 hypothetical protein [Bacillus aquiflavi]